jgi:ubiquitin thioesterase protein OTUB1
VFGYFEVLLQLGDLAKVGQERARLRAFDDIMRAAGIPVDMLEDMFDCSYELLDRIKAAIEVGDDTENTILHAMNNEGDSSCILYHFKASSVTTYPHFWCHFCPLQPLTMCRA